MRVVFITFLLFFVLWAAGLIATSTFIWTGGKKNEANSFILLIL